MQRKIERLLRYLVNTTKANYNIAIKIWPVAQMIIKRLT